MALGNILRGHKKFAECAETYGKAIAHHRQRRTRRTGLIFYFRGICYERSKQWAKAEADLKKALELFPDQPHVLNYLGYSWIDQGINLDEGMAMIRRAVEQRPDDGYIVDSLGWAYYRLGNYEEATKHLERAIELKPEDPTINDHLGDAYWRVGRKLEAQFQWAHARDLKPEPEELPKIEEKLKNGLPDETSSQAEGRQEEPATAAEPAAAEGLRLSAALVEIAPAKINLTLRVLGRRADGYHDLESLVGFADVADRLTLEPAGKLRLDVTGRLRCGQRAGSTTISCSRPRAALGERDARPQGRALHAGKAHAGRRPASAAARPMRRRRCGCWRGQRHGARTIRALACGRACDRRRCAGLPRCRVRA